MREDVEKLLLLEIEGRLAYKHGKEISDVDDLEEDEKDAWLLGYLEEKINQKKNIQIINLRQAIKLQTEHIQNYIDVEEVKRHAPDNWWIAYLHPKTKKALLEENQSDLLTLENLIKKAIKLQLSGFLQFKGGNAIVDDGKLEFFIEFSEAIDKLIESKR